MDPDELQAQSEQVRNKDHQPTLGFQIEGLPPIII
jgi:hypothetical protein